MAVAIKVAGIEIAHKHLVERLGRHEIVATAIDSDTAFLSLVAFAAAIDYVEEIVAVDIHCDCIARLEAGEGSNKVYFVGIAREDLHDGVDGSIRRLLYPLADIKICGFKTGGILD